MLKRVTITIVTILLLTIQPTVGAVAGTCMRYNHRRVCPGDSIADVLSLFGEPLYRTELGEIQGPGGSRKLELWIYQHKLKRWEIRIACGRVLDITRIRLRRVR